MNNLQKEYDLIQEGRGNKSHFLKLAKLTFPGHIGSSNTFEQAVSILKGKSLLAESNVESTSSEKKDWRKIFEAEVKAMEKETSKEVIDVQDHQFDYKDEKNIDNLYGTSFLLGYIAEISDPKNAEKTVAEVKEIVAKNMAKDRNYYMKNAAFSINGIGYTESKEGKEPTGKFKSSGYGDLKEVKYSLIEMMGITQEELDEIEDIEEGPMDQQIAAAEKKVEDLGKQVAKAELDLANIKKKEAEASAKI